MVSLRSLRRLPLAILLAALACGRAEIPVLQVYGTDMGGTWENVAVVVDGSPTTDANVVVNGTSIPYFRQGTYSGMIPVTVPAGGTLSLSVTRGRSSVTGSGTVPEPPTMTSPAAGDRFAPGADVPVSWTSTTNADRFSVNVQWSCGPSCGTGVSFLAPAHARSLIVPGGAIPAGELDVSVFAYNDGTLVGDYASYPAYPGMNIRSESGRVTISH